MPLALAAALIALFAIACSSGGGSDQTTSDKPAGPTDGGTSVDLVSAAPLEVLSASADNFEEEVESLQMEMEFTMNAGGFVVDSSSEMAFQAPDQMHMTMDLTGLGSFEMLMLGTEIYVNIPMQGWVVMSVDDLGLGEMGLHVDSFEDTFSNHSFVDYGAIVDSLGVDIEDLGEETVDGAASGEFAFGADAMEFDATMRFFGYNEPAEIPDPPEDAVSFAELFSGLFEETQ
jgi:hypothetical protein